MLIGLPGSGKTSFFNFAFAGIAIHISKDLLKNNRIPTRRQMVLLEDALRNGENEVIDNTNPRIIDRAPLIDIAKTHGAEVNGFVFPSNVKESLARNRLRAGSPMWQYTLQHNGLSSRISKKSSISF